MRVLHVSQPVDAGVPAVVASLVTDQVRRGHDAHVACPSASVLMRAVPAAGGTTHVWEATRQPGSEVIREMHALNRIIALVDPDVVVLHSSKAALVGRLAIRGDRPTVVVPHAWSFLAATGTVAAAVLAWERFADRWTNLLVCVGPAELARGRAAGITAPAVVIDNGTHLGPVDARTPAQARADLGMPEGPTVVCVGRLTRQKGQDLLLRSWPAVRDAVAGARLVLVGNGPDEAGLRALAGPDVVFTGHREDVGALLSAADVVVVPSRWEGAPLVTLEAMAAARPVVGFDVDGVAHALGGTGIVVPPESVPALSAGLVRLLTDPAGARHAGLAARQRVQQRFDLDATLEYWDRELRGLVAWSGHLV